MHRLVVYTLSLILLTNLEEFPPLALFPQNPLSNPVDISKNLGRDVGKQVEVDHTVVLNLLGVRETPMAQTVQQEESQEVADFYVDIEETSYDKQTTCARLSWSVQQGSLRYNH